MSIGDLLELLKMERGYEKTWHTILTQFDIFYNWITFDTFKGCLEFDDEAATLEDAILKDTVEAYNRRMKEFEEHTKARSRQLAAFMGHHQVRQICALELYLPLV